MILIHGGFCIDDSQFTENYQIGTKLKRCYLNDMRLLDTGGTD